MKAGQKFYIGAIVAVLAGALLFSVQPVCGNGILDSRFPSEFYEECDDGNNATGDGCSASCRIEFDEKIYVAPYIGNVEGHFSEEWFFFYGQLIDYYNTEQIPVGATVFPATLDNHDFNPYIKRMYESDYIEIVQKAWTGLGEENEMDRLTYEAQKDIISKGRNAYRSYMSKILGIPEDQVKVPMAYNQPQGRFTNDTRRALEDLGFRIFFEMYMNDDLGPVASTDRLDVMQYGVGMTTRGDSGRNSYFFGPGEVLRQIRDFDRDDLDMMYINDTKVVPLWVHQMDFESRTRPNTVDQEKWQIYTHVMDRLKEEPNIEFISASEIWQKRHPSLI
jgi:cysteine-rich repeat protein